MVGRSKRGRERTAEERRAVDEKAVGRLDPQLMRAPYSSVPLLSGATALKSELLVTVKVYE